MKKLSLIFFFIFSIGFSQSKINVRGVTLSYNQQKRVMTLVIPEKLMKTTDPDAEVRIRILEEYSLTMVINGQEYTMTDEFFLREGRIYDSGWTYLTIRPGYCKEVKANYVYEFSHLQASEYILEVSDVCDNRWVTNKKSQSITIR
jgi:hypothetical protein